MRILFITHAFNGLSQRLFIELTALGHEVSIELDINDQVTAEAVELFRPHLILAPYLRRAIPESIWRKYVCLIVHPGVVGDRGPSALDWAILNAEKSWGVTVLQAEAEMDAGAIWAEATFPMRIAKKSSLYRHEVTEAAVKSVCAAVARLNDYKHGIWQPIPLHSISAHGQLRPLMRQIDRTIDWLSDDSMTILNKINVADGFPGVADRLFDQDCFLYDARIFPAQGRAGELLGMSEMGVVRATIDGAIWIGHVRSMDYVVPIKLPTTVVFPQAKSLPSLVGDSDIRYVEQGEVGYLYFEFYNGAMGTMACERLLAAYRLAKKRPIRVIVLMGGTDFFSNGLDLNIIEAAESPADESWQNINAMDDLCREIIETTNQLTVSVLQGNAGAGGAFLALAADYVWARHGIILNPHYMNMGNLYGSEYWSYLLPRRVGTDMSTQIMHHRLPMGVVEAHKIGFIDDYFESDLDDFVAQVTLNAELLAGRIDFSQLLANKNSQRAADELQKPLSKYRAEELVHMQRNFYGFDPSYHVARHHFVHKTLHSWSPRHLAKHRDIGWEIPQD